MANIEFDESALEALVRQSPEFQRLEKEINEKMRDEVRAVNATHARQPVAEVDAELRRRFDALNITPSEPNFSEIVQDISDGTLNEN
jgi:hypothetical protein